MSNTLTWSTTLPSTTPADRFVSTLVPDFVDAAAFQGAVDRLASTMAAAKAF